MTTVWTAAHSWYYPHAIVDYCPDDAIADVNGLRALSRGRERPTMSRVRRGAQLGPVRKAAHRDLMILACQDIPDEDITMWRWVPRSTPRFRSSCR